MRYLLLLFAILLFCGAAEARSRKPQEGARIKADWSAEYMFSYLDKDGDGRLSLEEYKQMNMTRDAEKAVRKDQRMGIYRTLEEEFKLMDLDEDGFIVIGDLSYYLTHQAKEREARKKLDYPLKRTEQDIGGEKVEVIEIIYKPWVGRHHPPKAIKKIEEEEAETETSDDKELEE